MTTWPQGDNDAIDEPPQGPPVAPSPIEIKAQLAAQHVREGLPAGERELEEVLADRAGDDRWLQQTMFTRAEREEMDAEYVVDERIQELLNRAPALSSATQVAFAVVRTAHQDRSAAIVGDEPFGDR